MEKVSKEEFRLTKLSSLGLVPLEDFTGSKKNWLVQCSNCHERFTIQWASLRSNRLRGCKFCPTKLNGSKRRYSTAEAEEILKSFGRQPLEPYVNGKKGWKSKCMKCGLIDSPSLSNILAKKTNVCWVCGNEKRGLNRRMSQEAAQSLFRSKGVEMTSPYVPRKKVSIRCLACGKESTSSMTNIYKVSNACGYCSNRLVDPEDARKLMIQNGYIPLVEYPLSSKRWKSIHVNCGKTVYPSYETIRRGGGGCSSCAKQGFDATSPAYVYFIGHDLHHAYKIGIGNDFSSKRNDRIQKHLLEGWELIQIWKFPIGEAAQVVEKAFLEYLRMERKIPVHLSKSEMPQGGWTETFSADSLDPNTVIKVINTEVKKLRRTNQF